MKNLTLYMMMFLGACFTACDEDFNKDVAVPQSYEQEALQTVDGFTVGKTADFSTIVLDEAALEANAPITVFNITAMPAMAEGATVNLRLEAAKKPVIPVTRAESNSEETIELPSVTADNAVTIAPGDLNEVVKELYGKAPQARELYILAYIYINDGTSSSMVPTPMQFGPITVTPVGPVIESAYYLYGAPTGWDKNDVLKFTHSGKDVYEDAVFSIMVPAVKGDDGNVADCYFKIASQSSVDAQKAGNDLESVGIWGCAVDGDESLEGTLVSTEPQAIKVAKGDYQYIRVTLNMMEGTYQLETVSISPYLWVPGNHQQSWNPADAPQLYSPKLDMYYSGCVYLNGGFKFTAQPSWKGDNPKYSEYGFGDFTTHSESITDDSNNMKVAEGFYYVEANLTDKEIKATLTEWAVVGDATPGGWTEDTDMTYNKVDNTWTVTTRLETGTMKFRANKAWAINYGGTLDKLEFNSGDNIEVITPGEYKIVLHLGNDSNSRCELISVP